MEAYPQDTAGKKISSSFLYDGTRSMFEKAALTTSTPRARTTA